LWHDDGLLANRAINLRANIIRVALNVLAACRTEKLEFRHNESLFTDYDTRAGDLFEENRPIFQFGWLLATSRAGKFEFSHKFASLKLS
jgi:hypothetical protein